LAALSARGQARSQAAAEAVSPSTAVQGQIARMPIDLPTALQLANSSNPTIALARARVREAYAHLREAQLTWLPDLRTGPAYLRHDGLIQNSAGAVFQTSKWNFYMGGGAVIAFDTSTALFAPLVAQRLVEAQRADARGVRDSVQLEVALGYLDLLELYGRLAINADTLARALDMYRNAEAAYRAGLSKTPADITRAQTELDFRRQDRINIEGQVSVGSARLARLLRLQPDIELYPADPTVLPVLLVSLDMPLDNLLAIGMQNRPEAAESRALVRAACLEWRQARVGVLLPRLEVGYTAGEFGGGRQDNTEAFGGRGDGAAQAIWELHNLGAGDVARARARRARFDESNWHAIEVQTRIGEDVTVAAKLARAHDQNLANAEHAVQQALETWRRLKESSFGMAGARREYDPLEPLIAERDLDQARARYLNEVIEFNKAQFRLFWALGQPPQEALAQSAPQPRRLPVVPPPIGALEQLPQASPSK
jgi:outer membrane protein TolC